MRHHLHLPRVSPRARSLAIVLPLLLTLSACGAASAADPIIDDQPIETTTTTVDPYAVPETIDLAYVTKVIQELENIRNEVRSDVKSTKQYSKADEQKLNAIFAEPALSFQTNFWSTNPEGGHPNVVSNPQPAKVWAYELVEVHPDCIWVRSQADDPGIIKGNTDGKVDTVLVKNGHDESINPTPWVQKQFVPVSLDVVDHGERACG